jgi:DMSO reductase anchor subunit
MIDNMPLVFFTVLAQAAAGLSLALCVMRLCSPQSTTHFYLKGYIVVLALLAVAGIASFGHLGHPMRVLNVLLGIRHGSPLSIEIFAVLLFGNSTVLAIFTTLLPQKKWLTQVSVLPAIAGMLFVYAISHVYNLDTVSAWHTMLTPLQFYTTSLLLGFFCAWMLQPSDKKQQNAVTIGIALAVAAVVIVQPLMFIFYGEIQVRALEAFIPVFPLLRFVLLALAILLWFAAVRKERVHWALSGSVCGLLVISELLGRAYFYDLLNLRLL